MNEQQQATSELKQATFDLIGNDLIDAFAAIGVGLYATIKTKKSAMLIAKAWKFVGKVSIEEKFEEIDVLNDNGELIDILNGKLIGFNLFADIRKTN